MGARIYGTYQGSAFGGPILTTLSCRATITAYFARQTVLMGGSADLMGPVLFVGCSSSAISPQILKAFSRQGRRQGPQVFNFSLFVFELVNPSATLSLICPLPPL